MDEAELGRGHGELGGDLRLELPPCAAGRLRDDGVDLWLGDGDALPAAAMAEQLAR